MFNYQVIVCCAGLRLFCRNVFFYDFFVGGVIFSATVDYISEFDYLSTDGRVRTGK